MADLFPDAFPACAQPEPSAYDTAIKTITALHPGDVIAIGSMRFLVCKEYGVSKYLTKIGTKGTKFYFLKTLQLEPLIVGACQMLGGGTTEGAMVVTGPLTKGSSDAS
jgi:hypothetical protein